MTAATHRLENIETHEVSLVDRPANGRRWLVTKASERWTAGDLQRVAQGIAIASGELARAARDAGASDLSPEAVATLQEAISSANESLAGLIQALRSGKRPTTKTSDETDDDANPYQWPEDMSAAVAEGRRKGEYKPPTDDHGNPIRFVDDMAADLAARRAAGVTD